jgi:hypothetical protein
VRTPSNPAWVQYRATSKAGVALGTHDVLTQQGLYKVVGLSYTDRLIASGLPPAGNCTFGATQDNIATFASSGDGGLSPGPAGSMTGFLRGYGTLDKSAVFAGCQTSDGINWSPCTLTGTDTEQLVLDVDIVLPRGRESISWSPAPTRSRSTRPRPCRRSPAPARSSPARTTS